jgi:hypothetical protein
MPTNCTIVKVESTKDFYFPGDAYFEVEVPDLPDGETIETTPAVTHRSEEFTWNWLNDNSAKEDVK